MRSHRQQLTRLRRPWDSPGKNAGVGCHFLLQCMKVKSESEVTESCLTLSFPMKCSLPCSSVHGIFQARVLEWGAIAFSRGKHSLFNKWCWESCVCTYLTLPNSIYLVFPSISWRRQWHPTPVLLPGKSHGPRSLVGYSPWGCKESDTTEQLHF